MISLKDMPILLAIFPQAMMIRKDKAGNITAGQGNGGVGVLARFS